MSKIRNKNKKGIMSYIKYSAMQQRITEFGFSLSVKKYVLSLFISALVCFIVAYLFKLKPAYIATVVFLFIMCIPFLTIFRFKFNFQQKKFAEVTLYLQQMAYSFKRKPKILNALIEVEKMTGGKLNARINEAIESIKCGNSPKDALKIISENYRCSRINTLHMFMIEVETYGGKYRKTISALIRDIEHWITRTMTYQKQRKNMQLTTTFSIVMSLSICAMVPYMLPEEITDVTQLFESTMYQIMTLVSLIAYVIFYLIVLSKSATSWLDLEDIKKNYTIQDIEKDYKMLTGYNVDKETIKHLVIAGVLGVICCAVYAITRISLIIPAFLVAAVMIILNPRMKYKGSKQRLQNNLTINFPNWIRSLVLLLQTNNFQVALHKSLAECNGALKVEVTRLIQNIEADPVSQQPYILFMEYFDAYDIKSIVRALYGISEYSQEEMIEQINAIIEQNDEVAAVAEKLTDNLKISGMQMYTIMPMLLGTVNLFVNMFIFGSSFFEFFNMEGLM